MTRTPDALLDSGLSTDEVAASIAKAFGLVVGQEIDTENPGWVRAAHVGLAMFDGGEDADDVVLSARDFAAMLRKNFARATDDDGEVPAFDTLDRKVRVAWECVARHLANVANFDAQEAKRLEFHEATIADMGLRRLATPEQ